MPATKNQDVRLEVLDELLAAGRWTVDDLLKKVNQRISDSFNTIDKRTLYRDIKFLEEKKNAPIHRPAKGNNRYYYTEEFSIKNIPIDKDDLNCLKKAVQILKQVDNFHLLKDVDDVIKKLENRIHIETTDQLVFVQFEKHTSSSGHEYFDDLLEAISGKVVLRITYQPYTQTIAFEKIVHPYLLKEFRNRWFLLGREENANRVTNYALDRIKKIKPAHDKFIGNDLFDPTQYFNHLIGVSVPEGAKPENIKIRVYKQAAPYILSKPIHFNQETLKSFKDGSILIQLNLIINYELKSILLSYANGIELLKPLWLREELTSLIKSMHDTYDNGNHADK